MTIRATAPPLAFVYDRHLAGNKALLTMRARTCAAYADDQGWDVGGWFVDTGDAALLLNQRPNFERLMRAIAAADKERVRVCLVLDWDRISNDRAKRDILVRRLVGLGARVETCFGERVTPDDHRKSVSNPTGVPRHLPAPGRDALGVPLTGGWTG
ncbi:MULTISPECIES: recombinase family protein [Streptomycetaceae]|uniref:Resolvase/invertase-type recombinase catalytic domain-containing protein n=1 Tax=Streptantibioticus cattleyicolor (strain ATCC 35852 / DSM 46488 / JCM 4925 / NBRC 14057 / NRRL 8057) TaxID=1003195 RepID=F8K0L1_STREN|nr:MULTISPECIES: recombinase family protein [Streptomycetaceae]AEW97417.1 hypothetical protein SCATT_50460 [Streptantibioticus cattleyicolor NRRL 8057 = DSM 46488]MYS61860.1 recombinase family protein [Streptomyces sp. SID5468]CCB77740.1 protein of unknown function [Streptantibioticus cattleyicolor NRRL 8057 = DSM 46488]